jgi:hypothetical protein
MLVNNVELNETTVNEGLTAPTSIPLVSYIYLKGMLIYLRSEAIVLSTHGTAYSQILSTHS